jgi:branched-chain amino acid aminotransferase
MLNSKIQLASEPCLTFNNRALLYGDTFSFELRGNSSKAFLYNQYYDYMIESLKMLKMDKFVLLKNSIFANDLELLLQKNRIYQGFSALVTVFRNISESPIQLNNSISILISVCPLDNQYYALNSVGLKVSVYKDFKLPDILLNWYRTPLFTPELLLSSQLKEQAVNDFLLINEADEIVKALDSNLFFVKDGNLIIPQNLANDSVKVFTDYIIGLAKKTNIPSAKMNVYESDLEELDEIFEVNQSFGIRWIVAYKEKRYYNKVSTRLLKSLNESLK